MIVVCIIVLSVIGIILGFAKSKFILNPLTVMFLLWGIIVPLSSLGLYDVDIPSEKAYFAILIGLIAFLIGGLLGWRPSRFRIKLKKSGNGDRIAYSYVWNKKLLYFLITASMAYYLYKLVLVISMLRSGATFYVIRELATAEDTNELRTSSFIIAVQALIASPTSFLMVAIMPIELLKEGKKNKLLIRLSIALMVLWVLTSGGRWVIMWFAAYFACVFLMKKGEIQNIQWKRLLKRFRMPILIGLILLVVFLLYITLSRKGNDVDLLKEIFVYFVAPVPYFSHNIQTIDTNYSDIYGLGVSSFYGFLYPLFLVIRLIIGHYPEKVLDIYYMSFYMFEKPTYIGGNIYMNAYVTAFYQPYLDGRLLGVFIILFILGYICCKSFYNTQKDNNPHNMLIYLLLLQKVMFSFVRFYFTMQPQGISFILAFFALKRIAIDSKAYIE